MRASEFLTEVNLGQYTKGHSQAREYSDNRPNPPWYDKAVQLKKDNPDMTASEIGRAVGLTVQSPHKTILSWLTGGFRASRDAVHPSQRQFPFTKKDFPASPSPYGQGGKPPWYEEAVAYVSSGMTISQAGRKMNKSHGVLNKWLVQGRKDKSGRLVNPDAPFAPKYKHGDKKIGGRYLRAEVKKLISDGKSDEDIINYIADTKSDKIANQVRTMLPLLRPKPPGTQVIDKTRTGNMKDPDITGLVQ